MDLQSKLDILSASARYDVSCSSSGSTRKNKPGGVGNAHASGICHSWADDGRCISLLKILFTNKCIYDCAYCINRASNTAARASFTPEEVANITMSFYRRNYIEGLFLSSAVYKSPDHTMELLLKTVKLLRLSHNFNGYIHLKAIPGADLRLIREAGLYADRMSVNIELPSSQGLKMLAPQKSRESILKPMGFLTNSLYQSDEEKRYYRYAPDFLPAGQTTQLIVGATPDSDLNILRLTEGLYKRYSLKRVYYSAYVPVSDNPKLPVIKKPPLLREHRLYQADWLLRFYGFEAGEILDESQPDLDTELDPKCQWALKNVNLFPVEINTADYRMLVRVPGIGIKSAGKIVAARRVSSLSYDDLKRFGIVLKRAKHFITCSGKFCGIPSLNEKLIRQSLLSKPNVDEGSGNIEQLSFFPSMQPVYDLGGYLL
jgi:putative DNA modification/repair radical SAM protein